jgi:hypothetical protein
MCFHEKRSLPLKGMEGNQKAQKLAGIVRRILTPKTETAQSRAQGRAARLDPLFRPPRRPQGMILDPARTLVPFWLFIDFNWHCD